MLLSKDTYKIDVTGLEGHVHSQVVKNDLNNVQLDSEDIKIQDGDQQIKENLEKSHTELSSIQGSQKDREEEEKWNEDKEDSFSIFSGIFSNAGDDAEFSKMIESFVVDPSSDEWSQNIFKNRNFRGTAKFRAPKWVVSKTLSETKLKLLNKNLIWKWEKEFTINNKRF